MREHVIDSSTTRDRALARIAVQPPYYDLEDLTDLGGGLVTARVPLHPPVGPETGPIEAAQVARHLAILGSCGAALARADDDRHHYLATRAHYMRLAAAPDSVAGHDHLEAQAVATWPDRRTARATVKLATPGGFGLNVLDVEYSVLTERMFRRLHPPTEPTDTAVAAERPFAPVEPEAIDGGLRLDTGPIAAADCAGHFPGHPAAPVAVVMGRLCRLAGQAAIERTGGRGRYRIEEGTVTASRLAPAGAGLVLEARYVGQVAGGHLLHGLALADGAESGRVEVTVSVLADGDGPRDPSRP